MDEAGWCFTSTKKEKKIIQHKEGAAPAEESQLVGQNWFCYIFRPTVTGHVANMKTVTAASSSEIC